MYNSELSTQPCSEPVFRIRLYAYWWESSAASVVCLRCLDLERICALCSLSACRQIFPGCTESCCIAVLELSITCSQQGAHLCIQPGLLVGLDGDGLGGGPYFSLMLPPLVLLVSWFLSEHKSRWPSSLKLQFEASSALHFPLT